MIKRLILFSHLLIVSILAQTTSFYNIRDFGAIGDGRTLDTKAIQAAINKCSESGGTVLIPPGKYLSGSIELKSNIDIYIQNGATILGSTNIKDYFERKPQLDSYNDYFLKHSLFYAEALENITIRGEGTINGQGSAFKVTTKVKPDRYSNRPFVFRFVECKNISIKDVTLMNSAMWMQQYLACENLSITGIKVFNHANQNNDMMDIDGCKNVIISDCFGDTDDDGITIKSTSQRITENVTITDCVISSHCNALKFGTESTGGFRNINISNIIVKPSSVEKTIFGLSKGISGITLATVDGGILEDVTISNIQIDGPEIPIFLRLGNRARKYKDNAVVPRVGIFKNVIIENIIAKNAGRTGCSITGIPNHYAENITLNNIKIMFSGGGNVKRTINEVPELEDLYPESTMWGEHISYGFFVRHVKGLRMNNIDLFFEQNEQRPAIVLDDVDDVKINDLNAMINKESGVLNLTRSKNVYLKNSKSKGYASYFISVDDAISNNIFLIGNDLKDFQQAVRQKKEKQVKIISNIQ